MNKNVINKVAIIFTLLISTNLWADENKKDISTLIEKGKKAAVFQKYRQAETLYQQAVKHGSAEAAYLLATHFVNGYGREVNIDQAIYWYEKARELGYKRAYYELGVMHHKYKHNVKEAQKYFEQAIDLGDIDAYHDLAILHINKKEYGKALILLTNSKVKYHTPSQYTLAQFYLFNIQVTKDISKAIELLSQAAESNYVPAIAQLGKIYASGQLTTKNLAQAETLFAKNYRLVKQNGVDLAWVLLEQKKSLEAKKLLETMTQSGDKAASAMLKNL